MFKIHCFIFINIYFTLTSAYLEVKLCEATPIDFAKLNVTEWDWNELSISSSTNRLIEKIRDNKEFSNETKLILASNIGALIDVFRVRNDESKKFSRAVQEYDFNGILKNLSFDLSMDIAADMLMDSQFLNKIIMLLQDHMNKLKDSKLFLEINQIILNEIKALEQKKDEAKIDLLKDLHEIFLSTRR